MSVHLQPLFQQKYPELPAKFHQLAWVKTVLLGKHPANYLFDFYLLVPPKPIEQAVPSPFLGQSLREFVASVCKVSKDPPTPVWSGLHESFFPTPLSASPDPGYYGGSSLFDLRVLSDTHIDPVS